MTLSQLKQLALKGQQHFANKHHRRQWFKHTAELMQSGRHLVLNGKFPEKVK